MHWFIQRCNGLIFMSEESKATFFARYQTPKTMQFAIIPHGHYRNSYPAAIDKDLAKTALALPLDKKVLLFFGMIKPYKNIDTLIDIFSKAEAMQYTLVVAGNPDTPELATRLKQLSAHNPDIVLFLQFIPDHELHSYLSAADAVILPYKTILNSGALLLALSFNQPVIAPHIGAFVGLQQQLGRHWVCSYDGELDAETLRKAIGELETANRPATCPLDEYNWDRLAAATLTLYQHL
jgi:glycosyltransferase involved in cell wall biosynthesis